MSLHMLVKTGIALLAAGVAPLSAAELPAGRFAFPIPWDDATAGSATDLSFLNEKPAGKNGRIVVRGDAFHESETGKRIRFIGINMGGDVAFPRKEDAEKIAAHFAKAGINVVRFHNLDGKNPAKTLIDQKYPDTQHFNEEHLDRFFYLIAKLKEQGIYSNINLRVMRSLTPGDGVPRWEDEPYPIKMVDRFAPRWIELQKKWAHDLLTRRNPYTGLSPAEDPCIVAVEISNENSIFTYGPRFTQMPDYYQEELRKLWNLWLLRRYGNDDALAEAWKVPGNVVPVIKEGQKWNVEENKEGNASAQISERADAHGTPDAAIRVIRGGGMDWHVQAQLTGLDLEEGENYTLSFRIRSDRRHKGRLEVQRDIRDWRSNGLRGSFESDSQWRDYTFSFIARDVLKDHVRVALFIGGSSRPNQFEIAGLKLVKGNPDAGLKPGESLAKRNIALPVTGGKAQINDGCEFLVDLDREFTDAMYRYLKDELKVQAAVIDTQVDYGGVSGFHREAGTDYTDVHGYWSHPEFIGRMWDFSLGNWRIDNRPQSLAMGLGELSTLQKMAERQVAGKPFSVSEYDVSFPNEFASEQNPLLAVAACLQDWDKLYLFCTYSYGNFGASDLIGGSFDNSNHPGKFGYLPGAALAFRTGAFQPLESTRTLRLPEKSWLAGYFKIEDAWYGISGSHPDILRSRLLVSAENLPRGEKARIDTAEKPSARNQSVALTVIDGKSFFTAAAPTCAVISGSFGTKPVTAGALSLAFKPFDGNFGAAMLNALDGKPIGESERLLLTVGARFENLDMNWTEAHDGLDEHPGRAPAAGVCLDGTVTIRTAAPRRVWFLDASGARRGEVPAEWSNGMLIFPVLSEHRTLYYEIVPKSIREVTK